MVKVDLGNLAPNAWPRVRGVFLTQPGIAGPYIKAWPPRRGRNQSPNSIWTAKQWAYAARWAANVIDIDYATAVAMTAGTDWMPRDLLMRAIYGTAYEVVAPDGTVWSVNPHSPPPPRRAAVTQWMFNQFDNANSTSTDAGAQCFKGGIITPREQIAVTGLRSIFTGVNTAQYKMVVCQLDAGNVIQAQVSSEVITVADTERRWREFSISATLFANIKYAILVGRTNGLATYAMPLALNAAPHWQFDVTQQGGARLANLVPNVGQTVTAVATNSAFLGILGTF